MEKTCRLVHITYRENNRGPGREEYNFLNMTSLCMKFQMLIFHIVIEEDLTNGACMGKGCIPSQNLAKHSGEMTLQLVT